MQRHQAEVEAQKVQNSSLVEKGSRMIVTFVYDNSPNNPANPDPEQAIRWGDRSEDEMMTSWIEYLEAAPRITSAAGEVPPTSR